MSILESAKTGILRPAVKMAAGVPVRFISWHDGNTYPLDGTVIWATMSASAGESEDSGGMQFTEIIKDYLIDVDELPVQPQNRDVIYRVDKNTYWAVLPDAGQRSVEPAEHHDNVHRIHTKQIADPTAELIAAAHGNADGIVYGNQAGDGYAGTGR